MSSVIVDPGSLVVGPPAIHIHEPLSRWHQDIEVHELIDHLNQPDKFKQWDNLTHPERRAVLKELDRCRQDFVYAARNYFWIAPKNKREMLFSLWPGQELILQRMLDLKERGRAAKLYIVKGRQLGAVAPETRVLTADFRWVPIEKLAIGQEIIACDEFGRIKDNGRRAERKIRKATILDRWEVGKEAFRIVFSNGESITATDDHIFLSKINGGVGTQWKKVSDLKVTDPIRMLAKPWGNGGFEDGWFGGILDGEGYIGLKGCGGAAIQACQVQNSVLDRAASYLSANGYTHHEEWDKREPGTSSKFGKKPVCRLSVNRIDQIFRLLGTCRPSRLMEKDWWQGIGLPGKRNTGHAWTHIVSIESVGIRRMVDIRTSTGTFTAEGVVTHNCSTLIEALVAWRTMFFKNVTSLVVSFDWKATSRALFPIMCFIIDNLPWWLMPMVASRTLDEGIHFDNPKPHERQANPGINSKIHIFGANSSGVGQGMTLSACHFSEICDWPDDAAKEILGEDTKNAFVETDIDNFFILESTAKGANRHMHKIWKKSVYLSAKGMEEWSTLFLPAFFEASRVRAVMPGWEPQKAELQIRQRVIDEWVRCDNADCRQYHTRHIKGLPDRDGQICQTCKAGTLKPFLLSNEQLGWFEHRRENTTDEEDKKISRQEMCLTVQDAFQLYALAVFSDKCQEYAASTILEPIAHGDYDRHGNFHGVDAKGPRSKDFQEKFGYFPCFCQDCTADHRSDDAPCLIWEWPQKNEVYFLGADIGEGLGGNANFSVGVVLKISKIGGKDYQVATWRSNTTHYIDFARQLNWLGRHYNDAQAAPECNKYDAVVHLLRQQYGYPNIYRWKHLDSINIMSQKLGWYTSCASRPRLHNSLRRWLGDEQIVIRSHNLVEEIPNFVKDDDDSTSASGDNGENDDELFACMIALYCAHEDDYDDSMGAAIPKDKMTLENAPLRIACNGCGHEWPSEELTRQQTTQIQCPACECRHIAITRNATVETKTNGEVLIESLENGWTPDKEWANYGSGGMPDYNAI